MAGITKAQRTALELVFYRAHAPDELRRKIEADVAAHGQIEDCRGEWFALLSRCDEKTRGKILLSIQVATTAADLVRIARRFEESPVEYWEGPNFHVALGDKFTPLPNDIKFMQGKGSKKITDTIVGTGLVPASPSDRQLWIDQWLKLRRHDLEEQRDEGLNENFREYAIQELPILDGLPEPYMIIRAAVARADAGEGLLETRFDWLEIMWSYKFIQEQGREWNNAGRIAAALTFLRSHQELMADALIGGRLEPNRYGIEGDQIDEADVAERLLASPRMRQFEPGNLIEAGRAHFIAHMCRVAPAVPDAVLLIFGRFVMHEDELILGALREDLDQALRSAAENLEETASASQIATALTETMIVEAVEFWQRYERLLDIKPYVRRSRVGHGSGEANRRSTRRPAIFRPCGRAHAVRFGARTRIARARIA